MNLISFKQATYLFIFYISKAAMYGEISLFQTYIASISRHIKLFLNSKEEQEKLKYNNLSRRRSNSLLQCNCTILLSLTIIPQIITNLLQFFTLLLAQPIIVFHIVSSKTQVNNNEGQLTSVSLL